MILTQEWANVSKAFLMKAENKEFKKIVENEKNNKEIGKKSRSLT